MKNPNTPLAKASSELKARWFSPDYPNGEARFQFAPFVRDVSMFVVFPAICVVLANSGGSGKTRQGANRPMLRKLASEKEGPPAQIVSFDKPSSKNSKKVLIRKAPGTLVKVRLLNFAEGLNETPVQVRILDHGLGASFYGGTILGSGSPETKFSKMNIKFQYAKRRSDDANAFPIAARALSLNGTLGLDAQKKEGVFARGALGGANNATGAIGGSLGQSGNLQAMLLHALAGGFNREVGGEFDVLKNQASILVLQPGREFYVELTDFFPRAQIE